MSMRQEATKSLGVIPDNNRCISASSSSSAQQNHGVSYKLVNNKKQAGNRVTFSSNHLEQQQQREEVSPERLNKSREAVKAWLESTYSPTSVLLDHEHDVVTAAADGGRCSSFSSLPSVASGDPSPMRSGVIKQRSRDISPPKAAARTHDPNPSSQLGLLDHAQTESKAAVAGAENGSIGLRLALPNGQSAVGSGINVTADVNHLNSGERYRAPTPRTEFVHNKGSTLSRIHHLREVSGEGLGSSSVGSDYSLGAEWRAMLAAAGAEAQAPNSRLHNQQLIAAAAAAAAADGDGIQSELNYYSICAGDEEAASEAQTEEFVSCTDHQNSPQVFLKPPRTMKKNLLQQRDASLLVPELLAFGQPARNPKEQQQQQQQQQDVMQHVTAVDTDSKIFAPELDMRQQRHTLLQEEKSTEEALVKRESLKLPPNHVGVVVPLLPPLVASAHAITAVPNMRKNCNAGQEKSEEMESIPLTTTKTKITTPAPIVPQKLKAHENNAGVAGGAPPRSSKIAAEELTPMQLVLLQVKQHKVESKAAAWEKAKCSKFSNRYKREETKIDAWEDHQRAKANISLKQVEMKLEAKRARAFEKMQNELAIAHRKAEEKKAVAEAKRAEKAAKAAANAERMRRTGTLPWVGCLFIGG